MNEAKIRIISNMSLKVWAFFRCTIKHHCVLSDQTNNWIRPTTSSNQCPRISSLEPNSVSHNSGEIAVSLLAKYCVLNIVQNFLLVTFVSY